MEQNQQLPIKSNDPLQTTSAITSRRRFFGGLSSKLLILTIIFVMLSEVMIYIPSLANFRNNWLSDRLKQASIMLTTAERLGDISMLDDEAAKTILGELGIEVLSLRRNGSRHLIAMQDMPSTVRSDYDADNMEAVSSVFEAVKTMLRSEEGSIRVISKGISQSSVHDNVSLEIVVNEAELRTAMIAHSLNILKLSLLISIFTATLVYFSLRTLFVRPFRKVTGSLLSFSDDPENPERLLGKTDRKDELGLAQNQVSDMQAALQKMLAEKKNLAELGLAVSKINHDLRNILASAVLFSDRLQEVDDPAAKRFAPKLLRALDRAIEYCQSTLVYGRAQEALPSVRVVHLRPLIDEISELVGLNSHLHIQFENKVSKSLIVDADPEQLLRIILNLCRNAMHALEAHGQDMAEGILVQQISISALETNDHTLITIADTGPGISPELKNSLFKAFQSSSGQKGIGLGLAIADELVKAHSGSLTLDETTIGASFTIKLPRISRKIEESETSDTSRNLTPKNIKPIELKVVHNNRETGT